MYIQQMKRTITLLPHKCGTCKWMLVLCQRYCDFKKWMAVNAPPPPPPPERIRTQGKDWNMITYPCALSSPDWAYLLQWLWEGFLRFPGHGWTSHIYVCQTEGWQSNLLVCVFIRSLGPSKAPSLTWFLWTLTLALMGSLAQKVGLKGGQDFSRST